MIFAGFLSGIHPFGVAPMFLGRYDILGLSVGYLLQ